MKANSQLVLTGFTLLSLSALAAIVGCQQPYSYAPYQQAPYGQPAYGQPAYGQPLPPGYSPGGTIAPGSGTMQPGSGTSIPPLSSVPPGQFQQPIPGNGNNAPPFNPSNPGSSGSGTSVPDPSNEPSSPYFESSSTFAPKNTFAPGMANRSISQAGFTQTAARNQPVSVTAGERPVNFEPPTRPKRTQAFQPNALKSANPFEAPQEAKAIPSDIPLAPPLASKKKAAPTDSLEGTVRKLSKNEWILEFASPTDPFGGKLKLTGASEVLKVLQDGKRYRLQGFIESPAANPSQSQFHVEKIHPLGIPFAPKK